MRWQLAAAVVGCSFGFVLRGAWAQQDVSSPREDGAEVVRVACTQCHNASVFMQLRQGPDGWRRVVYAMVLRGAPVQPGDVDLVVSYLASHYGIANFLTNIRPPATLQLPDGSGRDLVEQRCTLCHSLERAAGTRRTRSEWDAILKRMVLIGAPISPNDERLIGIYLKEKVSL
jgi:cytochrome c5